MSDSEQPTATEQPEEQPVSDTPAETEPAGTGEDTATTDNTPAQEEPQADEAANADEGESGPSDTEPKPAEEGDEVEIEINAAEGETDEQPEPEVEVKEEPVVITPEGSPFWLSDEDVLAKGVAESEVENFKNFFFRQSHSLQAWYDQLKDYAMQSEFITLSKEEIEALSVEGEVSEEQQQVLSGLEDRVNQAIELFEEDGAVVRVNGRSPDDSIYRRNEETFIAEVRDAVVNELEVEKQRANAYAIWKDERPPSAFKRGINSLRQSLRRNRTHSTGKREARPKLEEEQKDDKKEEKQDESPKDETTEAAAEGDEATGGDTTVEVQVENDGEDKPADDKPADEEETPKDEGETAEAPKEEEETAEAPKEGETDEAPKDESEITEAPKDENETTTKEGDEAPKEESEAKEDEIEKVEEPKAEPVATKPSPTHHKLRKAKTENLDNQILRAFLRSTTALFKVKTGKEAIELLRRSLSVRNDLNQMKAFGGVEGVQVSLSVTRWQEQVANYPGMEFRGFVYKNELNALSQYNDTAYYPNTDVYFNTVQAKVQEFFKANIQDLLKELENYVVDFYVSPEKVVVMRLNPFYTAVEACLFPWADNGKVLTQGPFEFRIVNSPRTAPEAFSSFEPFWQTMLQAVLDQRRPANRSTKTCTLL